MLTKESGMKDSQSNDDLIDVLNSYIYEMREAEKDNKVLRLKKLEEYSEHIQYCGKQFKGRFENVNLHIALFLFNQCTKRWLKSQPYAKNLPPTLIINFDFEKSYLSDTKEPEKKLLGPVPNIPDNPDPKKSWDELFNNHFSQRDREFIKAVERGEYDKKY